MVAESPMIECGNLLPTFDPPPEGAVEPFGDLMVTKVGLFPVNMFTYFQAKEKHRKKQLNHTFGETYSQELSGWIYFSIFS